MQVIRLSPGEIKARAAKIRLLPEVLGRIAELSPSTAHRVLAGSTDVRLSTLERLSVVLMAEETRLLRHLIGLHPFMAREILDGVDGGASP
ncbi:MAG: hypothetical protein WBR29_07360 [Gammaproteobacteria bacterium]